MSKTTDALYNLLNNPFLLAELILKFYGEYSTISDKNVLLSYLILPLCLDIKFQEKRVSTRSSIRSLWNDKNSKEIFAGLPIRVQEYKQVTNDAIAYLLHYDFIKISKSLSVVVSEKDIKRSKIIDNELKAVNKIIKILQNEKSIVQIYNLLGISQL